MENTIRRTKQERKESTIFFAIKREIPSFFMSGIGFFLGRVALFQFMNPAALAFMSVFYGKGYKFFLISLFTAIGIISRFNSIYLLKYLFCLILMCAVEFGLNFFKVKLDKILRAIPGAVITLVLGLLFTYLGELGTYYIFLSVLEAVLVFALSFVLGQGVSVLEGKNKSLTFDNEIIISLAILLGGVLSGMSDIYIWEISLKYLFSASMILIMAYKGGASMGATAGVLLGFILTLTGFSNYALVGILSIAGMIAGLMKDTGKIGTVLGFVCGGVITSFYLDITILNQSLFFSTFLGAILFYIVPKDFQLNVHAIINKNTSGKIHSMKSKDIAVERLKGFSRSFRKLGDTFDSLSEKRLTLSQKDISRLIDDVAAKTCTGCKFNQECWETNFYSSYQMSFALLEICERDGYLSKDNIPEEFKEFCVDMDNFASSLNYYYDIYKNNISWNNKISESRELIGKQLIGVSEIIDDLSDEMEHHIRFHDKLEDTILSELIKNKIDVKNIAVMENKEGRFEISIDLMPCAGKRRCNKDILPVISTVLGRKMKKEEAQCYSKNSIGKDTCRLKIIEEEKFQFISAVGSVVKEGSYSSGDSYTFLEYKPGKYLLALSDGMGSGKTAKEESEASINLLEELMESGFDIETAINMINSILVLKSESESFSTLDICNLDCYDGTAQFVKIGAAPTFIIRGKSILTVESSALPIGILNEVEVKTSKRKIKDGDIIVMVTDGITEIKKGTLSNDWILEFLGRMKKTNPQYIADMVIERAKELSEGSVKDDITVLVARVWTRP